MSKFVSGLLLDFLTRYLLTADSALHLMLITIAGWLRALTH